MQKLLVPSLALGKGRNSFVVGEKGGRAGEVQKQVRTGTLGKGGLWNWNKVVFAALAATVLLVTSEVVRAPAIVGWWEDDGIYLVTAKSLAEGHGYRHLELPGEPYQTKYPVLYPLLLSAAWRINPEFPGNLSTMQWLNAVCGGVALWLAYRLLRRGLGMPAWLAGAAVVLAAVNRSWVLLTQLTMSEHFYACLSLAALNWLFVPATGAANAKTAAEKHGKSALLWAALSGLFAALACLTRSVGLSVAAAIVLAWLLRRRWKEAGVALLVSLTILGVWENWRRSAVAANAAVPEAAAFRYDLDYGISRTTQWDTLARVAWQNTSTAAYSLLSTLIKPPASWNTLVGTKGIDGNFAILAALLALVLLLVAGFVRTWRRSYPAVHLYVLLYLGLILIWPFNPQRFLIPLMPLLIGWVLYGVYELPAGIAWVGRRLGLNVARSFKQDSQSANPRPAKAAQHSLHWPAWPVSKWAGGGLAVVGAIFLYAHHLQFTFDQAVQRGTGNYQRERETLVQMLKTHTSPDARVAVAQGGYYYLMTGRKAVPRGPSDDPFEDYAPDRQFSHCGLGAPPSTAANFEQMLETRLLNYYRAAGVTHAIAPPENDPQFGRTFARFSVQWPGQFQLLDGTPGNRLYHVECSEPFQFAARTNR